MFARRCVRVGIGCLRFVIKRFFSLDTAMGERVGKKFVKSRNMSSRTAQLKQINASMIVVSAEINNLSDEVCKSIAGRKDFSSSNNDDEEALRIN